MAGIFTAHRNLDWHATLVCIPPEWPDPTMLSDSPCRKAVMDGHTPSDPVRVNLPATAFPAFLVASGQVLPQLSLPTALPINPRRESFWADPHARVSREIVGQSATDFF